MAICQVCYWRLPGWNLTNLTSGGTTSATTVVSKVVPVVGPPPMIKKSDENQTAFKGK
jgi:hypothetical protein